MKLIYSQMICYEHYNTFIASEQFL